LCLSGTVNLSGLPAFMKERASYNYVKFKGGVAKLWPTEFSFPERDGFRSYDSVYTEAFSSFSAWSCSDNGFKARYGISSKNFLLQSSKIYERRADRLGITHPFLQDTVYVREIHALISIREIFEYRNLNPSEKIAYLVYGAAHRFDRHLPLTDGFNPVVLHKDHDPTNPKFHNRPDYRL